MKRQIKIEHGKQPEFVFGNDNTIYTEGEQQISLQRSYDLIEVKNTSVNLLLKTTLNTEILCLTKCFDVELKNEGEHGLNLVVATNDSRDFPTNITLTGGKISSLTLKANGHTYSINNLKTFSEKATQENPQKFNTNEFDTIAQYILNNYEGGAIKLSKGYNSVIKGYKGELQFFQKYKSLLENTKVVSSVKGLYGDVSTVVAALPKLDISEDFLNNHWCTEVGLSLSEYNRFFSELPADVVNIIGNFIDQIEGNH